MFYDADTAYSGITEYKNPRRSWRDLFALSTGTAPGSGSWYPAATVQRERPDPDPVHNGYGNMRWHVRANAPY